MKPSLPNLFVVGFGRSGTTSLHNYLAQHPDIFMSPAKEPNFFCTDVEFGESRRARLTSRSDYERLFDAAEGEAVRGESSTMYILSDAAREAIASEVPDAKIVISIRNPVDFLISWHAHGVGIGYETAADLADALDLEDQRAQQPPHHLGSSVATTYRSTIHAMPDLIGAYLDTFGTDRVFITTFDRLTNEQQKSYSDLCRFLDVDDEFEPDFGAKNYDPTNLQAMSLFRKVPEPVRKRLGPVAKPIVRRAAPLIKKAKGTSQARPSVSPELKAALAEEFAPVVERLEATTGLDLVAWKTSQN